MIIKKMPLAQFKLAPTYEAKTNGVLCVMTHKREAFYTVTPERMAELLQAEDRLKELGVTRTEWEEIR